MYLPELISRNKIPFSGEEMYFFGEKDIWINSLRIIKANMICKAISKTSVDFLLDTKTPIKIQSKK